MGNDLLEQIKLLIPNLPKKDVNLGKRFIETRNFESLKDLVDSAIYINRVREANGKELTVRDFAGLMTLKVKVDAYYSLLKIPEQDKTYSFDSSDLGEEMTFYD